MRPKFKWKMLFKRYDNGGANPNNTSNAEPQGEHTNETENKLDTGEKLFTQADVNRMMKAEKEKGRRSVLTDLGVEDVKNAKEALEAYKKYTESQKSELQKATDDLQAANAKISNAEMRAAKAECCLKAISSFGAVSESVDDLVSIALSKTTDEKDVETVLKEMKENKAYAGFFNVSENTNTVSKGTGNPIPQGSKAQARNGGENYGALLAKKTLQRQNINNGGK